jgi:hypothetical protein
MNNATTNGNSNSNPTSPGDATKSPPSKPEPVNRPAARETQESSWLQQLQQSPDPLMRKLERNMIPLQGIYERMSEIVLSHLTQHGEIAHLQEIGRECDLVLQYNRQIGRLMKLEHDLRANRANIDRMKYFDPPQPSEK